MPSLVLGWLLISCFAELHAPDSKWGPGEYLRSVTWARGQHVLGPNPGLWNGRELRVLPGIGERRALGVLRMRRAHAENSGRGGSPAQALSWEEVPGIGVRTARGVREFLAARGARTLEVWTPPP